MSAVRFVAEISANVDAQRGIVTPNGTAETQAKVIAVVKDAFFKDDLPDASMLKSIPCLAAKAPLCARIDSARWNWVFGHLDHVFCPKTMSSFGSG
jgi:hypothetical protein